MQRLAALRPSTQTGCPPASDSFISKLEHTLGHRLRPLPVGRPKKEKPETRKNVNGWLCPISTSPICTIAAI
jgi:hypothetical protein